MSSELLNHTISFYKRDKPSLNELVLINVVEHNETHIKGSLIEYECDVFINYNDASKKKRPNWNKIIPVGMPIVGRVDDLCNNAKTSRPIVNVSISYLYDKETNAETLLDKFKKNKALLSMMKNLSHRFNICVDTLWETIVYEIDMMRRADYVNNEMPFLIDYIYEVKDNIEHVFESFENADEIYKHFIELMDVYCKENVVNITTKIEIISTGCINNTIETIKQCIHLLSFPHTLKYVSTPVYVLESSSTVSTKDDHMKFVEMLTKVGNTMNPKTFIRIQ
jgi:translation initiation factor 2 alpha subunit (eIF-2alpha)